LTSSYKTQNRNLIFKAIKFAVLLGPAGLPRYLQVTFEDSINSKKRFIANKV